MCKVKILVAQHKEAEVFQDETYMPIHVGKAISKIDLGIIGDDTGDNISSLNPYYCELTAQYWAWKNLHNVEYIGLCHYRRYFKTKFSEKNIEREMSDCDIILARRLVFRNNILTWYSTGLTPEDISVFHLYMNDLYRNDKDTYENFYFRRNWLNPANMFICKKKIFDEFCKWQFGILEDLQSIIPLSPYTRGRRLMGYLGESLLPFYAYIKKLRVKEIPLVPMIGDEKELFNQSFITKIKNNLFFTKGKQTFCVPDDYMVGLQADGLIDKINAIKHIKECDNNFHGGFNPKGLKNISNSWDLY